MVYYIRSISKQKWAAQENVNTFDADLIMLDLKTTDNCLSIWKVEDLTESALIPILKKLILSRDNLDRLDYVAIPADCIEKNGVSIESRPDEAGKLYEGLKNQHYDIVDINYANLKNVIESIFEATKESKCERVAKMKAKEIIKKEVKSMPEVLDNVSDSMRMSIKKMLDTKN